MGSFELYKINSFLL